MSRFMSPQRDQLDSLRTPLTEGERNVFKFFDEKLSDEWEIYIQPHLNGLRPDFVLLNPQVGIAVYEVKDWDLKKMSYRVEESENGNPELWATSQEGKDFRQKDNPVEKVYQYKQKIYQLYCPRLGIQASKEPNFFAVVTAGVIFTKASTEEANQLFYPFQKDLKLLEDKSKPYHPLVGIDKLAAGAIYEVFPSGKWKKSKYMNPALADDLRHWLVEPDFASMQRQPLPMNKEQIRLATTRTETGYRRIKGPAGSGKSLVVAARAAQLATEKKDILVVTFNITLCHYLRDLTIRYLKNLELQTPGCGKLINEQITWCNFHDWCNRMCMEAGLKEEYQLLWENEDNPDEDRNKELNKDLVKLVNQALDKLLDDNYLGQENDRRLIYDAILVDEAQDFNIDWWQTLGRVRRSKNSEMLLVADETQDLYNRAKYWTNEKMEGAGFSGKWSRLDISYRMPPKLIKYLQQYAKEYLPNASINLPESGSDELDLWPVEMIWRQVSQNSSLEKIAEICTQAVLDMPKLAKKEIIAYSDITLLVPEHKVGLKCVELLAKNNVETAHVFGESKREQRNNKLGFYLGDARVKASTIHSFKGWESSCMVIYINHADYPEELAAIYVALSRLKQREQGSYLIVICSTPKLENFGNKWPNYKQL